MVVHEYANEKGKWHVFPYSENLTPGSMEIFICGLDKKPFLVFKRL